MEANQFNIEKYNKAKKRVKELKEFYSHLASYLVVIPFLIFINLYFSPKHIWFYWPMLGWGIGLFFHAVGVFNIIPFFGKDWDDKKIKEIMEKEKNTKCYSFTLRTHNLLLSLKPLMQQTSHSVYKDFIVVGMPCCKH